MQAVHLARRPLGEVDVDLCADCQALWFDAMESALLTPGATIELFKAIHAAQPASRQPLPAIMGCPRCDGRLQLTHDLLHATRFTYYRCAFGHGRLTPFFQFLREKDFIHELSPAELERLKAAVKVIRCSSCGAPVNLERNTVCSFCRSPISVLDPDAVEKALAGLAAAETRRTAIDTSALVDSLIGPGGLDTGTPQPRVAANGGSFSDFRDLVDLVSLGASLLVSTLSRNR